jgi:L-ascorbate metabolism protein UlaG (beta-lactamase superfamily)
MIRLVRHATLQIAVGGRKLLVDPMLDPAGAREPVANTANDRRNPLVGLPEPADDVVAWADSVLVTHLHEDHLDHTAVGLIGDRPVFGQPEDIATLRERGLQAQPMDEIAARTGGRHGTGEIAEMLAPVSGFVLDGVYVAGDTVWCDEVAEAIERHRPHTIVVNAGGARFVEGDPITMDAADVRAVQAAAPDATVIAVHLEAINHCLETRAELAAAAPGVLIPADGESVHPGA